MRYLLEGTLSAVAVGASLALGGTPALAWAAAGVVLMVLTAAAAITGAFEDPAALRFAAWPAAFLAYAAFSITYSAVPARSVYFLAQWGAYFGAALVAFHCERRGGGRILIRALVWLAAAEALFGLVQYLTGWRQVFWYEKTRYLEDATGTYINHNHFAGLLVLAIGPALGLGIPRLVARRPGGQIYCGVAGLILLAMLFSRSRMGIAAGFFAALLFGIYAAAKVRKRAALFAAAAIPLVVVAYGAWIGLGPVAGRFALIAGTPESEPRWTIWSDSWELVTQRPWSGWGAGTFPAVYPLVRTEPSELRWMEAHNDYLQVACELGVPGVLLLFGPLFFLTGRLALEAWRTPGLEGLAHAAIAASLAGILLHEAVDFHLYVPANAIWILLLTGIGFARLERGF